MSRYLLQKTGYAFLVLSGVVLLIFFLFYILQIDPTKASLDQRSDAKTRELIMEKYGLDKPWYERLGHYLTDLSPVWVHPGDAETVREYHLLPLFRVVDDRVLALKPPYLGRSMQSGRRVDEIIGNGLANTAVLALAALMIALVFGLLLGIIAAVWKDSWLDRLAVFISSVGVSVPSYFSAILLSFLFGYLWKSVTGLNMIGSLRDYDGHLVLQNLILPAIALGIRPVAIITQLGRNAMLDVLQEDYIRTARAKGLPEWAVILKHGLRNALNPVITSVSGWFASLLAGAYFVEIIFNFKGLGYETVRAIEMNDFPVILGSVLAAAIIFVLINFTVDLLYAVTDPRVKVKSANV